MSEKMAVAKRKGRPPKSDKGAATVNLTMRLRPDFYEEIAAEAERDGRSISAQAEQRLKNPRVHFIGQLVGSVIDAVEDRAGKSVANDPAVRLQCRSAAEFVLNVMLGSPLAIESLINAVKLERERLDAAAEGRATSMLDTILGIEPPSAEKAEKMLAELKNWSTGQQVADDILAPMARP